MLSVSTFDLLWVRGVAVECMYRKTRAALLSLDDGSLQTEQGKEYKTREARLGTGN